MRLSRSFATVAGSSRMSTEREMRQRVNETEKNLRIREAYQVLCRLGLWLEGVVTEEERHISGRPVWVWLKERAADSRTPGA